MSDYFDALAASLRDRGVPQERITATIDDLTAYVQESGADPEEEFGPVADFAPLLCAEPAAGTARETVDAPAGDTWVWTVDLFADTKRLNEFGEQGWEVDGLDKLGRFVCHRDPERAQRWEYRRLAVTSGGRRALVDRLAPDGWEPCGTWFSFEYFKRPQAASTGPAADLDAPPPAPSRRTFFSGRFYLFLIVWLLFVVLAVIGTTELSNVTNPFDGADSIAGGVVGASVVLAAFWLIMRRQNRKR
jgi:hypothetical protein